MRATRCSSSLKPSTRCVRDLRRGLVVGTRMRAVCVPTSVSLCSPWWWQATFSVPDAAGLVLKNKPIDGSLPYVLRRACQAPSLASARLTPPCVHMCRYQSHLRTELELDSLVKKATAAGFKCTRSWDAGEYLCNYLYFHSLQYCKKAGFPAVRVLPHRRT